MTKKIVAIGDIHGMLFKLESLLDALPISWETDLVIFLGDYVDRGPDPKGVVERLVELRREFGQNIRFLLGNHEYMFLNYLERRGIIGEIPYKSDLPLDDTFLATGGESTLGSYFRAHDGLFVPEDHLEFFLGLVPMIEEEEYVFVHAGLRPKRPIHEQSIEDLLWIRHEFIDSDYDWGKRIVFGHTPLSSPLVQPQKIGIDTGAVYGGPLTAVILPELRFVQV
ncbi:MAG TPA: serine/threonine protein phosphatase [Dissulfuribacter thermophilus]|uniref:Serine/threonine protein phosphatase n=1 Tax=Dissulfuribacter thermophilus TaxID=1156395 RepID=A0A7V2SVP2_9BACT|nr:serine/threonine protein phosphatase [Dissulfuribacter thermophilus]